MDAPITYTPTPSTHPPLGWTGAERRRQRSRYGIQALRLQLRHVQRELGLDALVLSDDLGELLAWSGRRDAVRSVAAQAPWLLHTPRSQRRRVLAYLSDVRRDLTVDHVAVAPIEVRGWPNPLILCGVGDSGAVRHAVAHAARGVHRILHTMSL